MSKKIIVIGAGIIGASISYYLAKAGADVQIIDVHNARGGIATSNSWAWINASWGNDAEYVKLRLRSLEEWHDLATVNPKLAVNWCGSLLWDLPDVELRNYAASNPSVKLIDRLASQRLEPAIAEAPELAVHAAHEGVIEPFTVAEGFMSAAVAQGAKFLKSEVLGFTQSDGRVSGIDTSDNHLYTDEIIIAAGVQSKALLKTLGMDVALDAIPGLLVHSKPVKRCLNGLVIAPNLHVRQTNVGRLVAGTDFGGTEPGTDPTQTAKDLFAALKLFLSDSDDLEMEFYTLGHRPTPRDGLPAIGRPHGMKGLYLAVMHSGITLAPAVGKFVTQELLFDQRDPLLKPYHPDRLISV
jgi:glycine/D-amino acid oxidase-like deaminating enzyme